MLNGFHQTGFRVMSFIFNQSFLVRISIISINLQDVILKKYIYPVVICLSCLATDGVKALFFGKGVLKNIFWLNV